MADDNPDPHIAHHDNFDEDSLPVVGNYQHPLVYGVHRVNLSHAAKIEIALLVPPDEFWSSLYVMFAEQFWVGVHGFEPQEFIDIVVDYYVSHHDSLSADDQPSMSTIEEGNCLWMLYSWICAQQGLPAPPRY